ncbi:MAG: hypothetical protein MJE68_33365 [Proteobacteria bacterium]|nr:hypothetical protein [Pseudomonadota bacterium]
MKVILLKVLEWLRVVIKNRDSLKAAWDLVHPLLKKHLNAEWLDIVDRALKGLTDEAMEALTAAEEAIKNVFDSNKIFMENIRKLDEGYYPGILKAIAGLAVTGAAAGGGGGALVGGPVGAAVGAVVGVTAGAVGGFLAAGYRAVMKQEKVR